MSLVWLPFCYWLIWNNLFVNRVLIMLYMNDWLMEIMIWKRRAESIWSNLVLLACVHFALPIGILAGSNMKSGMRSLFKQSHLYEIVTRSSMRLLDHLLAITSSYDDLMTVWQCICLIMSLSVRTSNGSKNCSIPSSLVWMISYLNGLTS